MSDFDPVEIEINFKQNVDTEGEKASRSIDEVTAASNKMKEQMEANINAQKAVIRQLTTEMDRLKKMLESKVSTPDSKLITEKQKLTEEVARLKAELEQAEKTMTDLQSRQQAVTNEVVTGTAKMSQGMKYFAFSTKEELQESVAIQEKVISGLKTQLTEASAAFGKVNIGTQDPAQLAQREKLLKVVRELQTELKGEEAALVDLQKQTVSGGQKMKTLETQLRETREAMAALKMEGKQNSAEYGVLEKKLGTLGTAYREMAQTQQTLSKGGAQLSGLLSGLSAVSGMLSAGAGAFGLISNESEQFNKIQTKVQSLMAITIGLQQVANTLHATSAFRIATVTKAKELWAAANIKVATTLGISTVAAKALMATLSLGLTVAIGVVIALIDKYATKQRKAAEETKKFNESVIKSSSETIVAYQKLRQEYQTLGNDLKAQEKFILENKDAFKELGFSVNDVNEAEKFFSDEGLKAFVASVEARAKAIANMELAADHYQNYLKKMQEAETRENNPTNLDEIKGTNTFVDRPVEKTVDGRRQMVIDRVLRNSSAVAAADKLRDEAKKYLDKFNKDIDGYIKETDMATQKMNEAGNSIKLVEGTEAWWKKKQEEAKARIEALKDTQQGSEKWKDAVEDYNQATEKLKLYDIKGNNKEEETAAEKAKRLANERLEAEQELAQKEIEIQLNTNKALLALMDEGTQKLKAQAGQSYQERLAQLDEQEKGYLDQLNKSKNLKPSDKGYITSLATYTQQNPDDSDAFKAYSSLNEQRLIADQQYVKDSEKLEMDAAEARKKIWDQVYEIFMSDIDRQKAGINDFYDEKIKAITEAGGTQGDIDQMNAYRAQELSQVQSDAALKLSSFYKDAFGDIDRYGTAALRDLKEQIDEVMNSARQIDQAGKTMIQVEIPTDKIDQDGKVIKETVTMTIEEFNNLQNKANEVNRTLESKNPFAAVGSSFKDLKKAIKAGDKDATSTAFESLIMNAQSALGQVKELGAGLREAFGDKAGDVIDGITGVAEGALDIAQGIATGNPVAVLTGVVKVYNTLTKASKEAREANRQYLKELISMQIEYNAVLNEQIRLQDQANIFMTDYVKAATDAYAALLDAQDNFNKQLVKTSFNFNNGFFSGLLNPIKTQQTLREFLSEMDIRTGTDHNLFQKWNTYSKLPDYLKSIGRSMDDLISASGELNTELAETLLGNNELWTNTNNSSKQALEALIEYQKEIEEAQQAIADAVKSLVGSLASDLSSTLRDAWKGGTDGFLAFKKTVGAGLEDIISELSFNSVFSGAFTQLQKDMTAALTSGGSQSDITAAYKDFYSGAGGLVSQYNDLMNAAKAAAEAAGFDWSEDSESERTASSKGIAQASQESVDENNGRLTAIQGFVYDLRNYSKESIDYDKERKIHESMIQTQLQTIADNTSYCKHLESIKRSIDDINLKGIRIKTS